MSRSRIDYATYLPENPDIKNGVILLEVGPEAYRVAHAMQAKIYNAALQESTSITASRSNGKIIIRLKGDNKPAVYETIRQAIITKRNRKPINYANILPKKMPEIDKDGVITLEIGSEAHRVAQAMYVKISYAPSLSSIASVSSSQNNIMIQLKRENKSADYQRLRNALLTRLTTIKSKLINQEPINYATHLPEKMPEADKDGVITLAFGSEGTRIGRGMRLKMANTTSLQKKAAIHSSSGKVMIKLAGNNKTEMAATYDELRNVIIAKRKKYEPIHYENYLPENPDIKNGVISLEAGLEAYRVTHGMKGKVEHAGDSLRKMVSSIYCSGSKIIIQLIGNNHAATYRQLRDVIINKKKQYQIEINKDNHNVIMPPSFIEPTINKVQPCEYDLQQTNSDILCDETFGEVNPLDHTNENLTDVDLSETNQDEDYYLTPDWRNILNEENQLNTYPSIIHFSMFNKITSNEDEVIKTNLNTKRKR